MPKEQKQDEFINTAKAAEILGLSVITLERMRADAALCKQLPFYRHGKKLVRYKLHEVEAYRDSRAKPN